jgi:hypothetical protein
MKMLFSLVALCALVVASGCAKKESVDTVKLEASFSTAEPSTKSEVDKIVASIKNQDWSGATASLKSLASNAKLTEEQKQSVNDTLADIGNKFKEAANKAGQEIEKGAKKAGEALEDAKKSLAN